MNELLLPKVGPLPSQTDTAARAPNERGAGPAFDRLLGESLNGNAARETLRAVPGGAAAPGALKFSSHAMNRIRERSIPMGGEMMSKLEKAVDTAAQKGAKESLILTSDAAFIVSVKNKTVITVVDRNQMQGNVFTNIDSTVVI